MKKTMAIELLPAKELKKQAEVPVDFSALMQKALKYDIKPKKEVILSLSKFDHGSLLCGFLYFLNPALLLVTPINTVPFENFIKSLLTFFVFKSCIVPIRFIIPTST